MKLSGYPRYKASSVRWLGDVPEHWEVSRIKRLGSIRYGLGEPPEYADDGLPFIRATDIKRGKIDLDAVKRVSRDDIPWRRRPQLHRDEILVVRSGAYTGDSAIVTAAIVGCIAGYDMVLTVRRAHPPFVAWALLSKYMLHGQIYLVRLRAAQPHLNAEELGSFSISMPPASEQQTIAKFLDRETERMDRLLGKNRELIERLREKRTALISRTVTRGLPPSAAHAAGFSEHPALKPSGLDWINYIPAHWEVRKFSREVGIAEGQVDPEKEPYASMVLIGPEHVESGTGRLLQQITAADQAAESGKYLCRKGDVVYSKIRPALRKLVIAPVDCLCSADMYPLRGLQRVQNGFIYWLFLSEQFSAWSVLEADRVAMPKINRDTLNELRMPVPPRAEQIAIAAYLELETAKLDALVAKVVAAIERLQEYRAALITAAVTGKIDVREAAT